MTMTRDHCPTCLPASVTRVRSSWIAPARGDKKRHVFAVIVRLEDQPVHSAVCDEMHEGCQRRRCAECVLGGHLASGGPRSVIASHRCLVSGTCSRAREEFQRGTGRWLGALLAHLSNRSMETQRGCDATRQVAGIDDNDHIRARHDQSVGPGQGLRGHDGKVSALHEPPAHVAHSWHRISRSAGGRGHADAPSFVAPDLTTAARPRSGGLGLTRSSTPTPT
jgi:hypothetical protein